MTPQNFTRKAFRKIRGFAKGVIENKKYRQLAESYEANGVKSYYHVHIRKTGGTSLNKMFLNLSGTDSNIIYEKLDAALDHRLIENKLAYVGWNKKHIESGKYFYAFSHIPYHQLVLPQNIFTFTCFRDPVKRVVSHFNMLMEYKVNNTPHPCMQTEGKWLGDSFADFLQNIPRTHLLNQLYMFSPQFNVNEAVNNAKQLSHVMFTEQFDDGVHEFNQKSNLQLQPIHTRKTGFKAEITDQDINELKSMLKDEYDFLSRLRN